MKPGRLLLAGMAFLALVGCSVRGAEVTTTQILPTQEPSALPVETSLEVLATPTKRVFPTFTPRPTAIPRALSDADAQQATTYAALKQGRTL